MVDPHHAVVAWIGTAIGTYSLKSEKNNCLKRQGKKMLKRQGKTNAIGIRSQKSVCIHHIILYIILYYIMYIICNMLTHTHTHRGHDGDGIVGGIRQAR